MQWHPEVKHSVHGQQVLEHFLFDGAQVEPTWSTGNIIEEHVQRIRAQVGSASVICGLSGGVDSAVAAALVQRAVGDQLTCVFVDHGLLREGEAEQVEQDFVASTGVQLRVADASKRFLDALSGVTDPEEKRLGTGKGSNKGRKRDLALIVTDSVDHDTLLAGIAAAAVVVLLVRVPFEASVARAPGSIPIPGGAAGNDVVNVAGFVVTNMSRQGERLVKSSEQMGSAVMVVFFATAGAHLDLEVLKSAWMVAVGLADDYANMVGREVWLKAENLRWAQELAPGFEVIETWNAQSNPWMLDINVAMGFRPHVIWRGFQGDLVGIILINQTQDAFKDLF